MRRLLPAADIYLQGDSPVSQPLALCSPEAGMAPAAAYQVAALSRRKVRARLRAHAHDLRCAACLPEGRDEVGIHGNVSFSFFQKKRKENKV